MKKKTLALCEAGIMIALSTVLATLKFLPMPHGGSATFAQMLPIIIFAYRHGPKYGMGAALTASMIQLLLGLDNFGEMPLVTWYSVVVLALLDYVVAYSSFGIVGFLKNKLDYKNAMLVGAISASVIRYLCHVISGFTVWTAFELPDGAVLAYSFGYNAAYMIPETIILVVATYYISSTMDFSKDTPVRVKKIDEDTNLSLLRLLSDLSVFVAIIVDTALICPKLQSEDGVLSFAGLANVDWISFAVVTLVCLGAALVFKIVEKSKKKDNQ